VTYTQIIKSYAVYVVFVMSDLTEFQLTTLALVAEESQHGLGVKDRLEDYYGGEVGHGRLYPNLDTLVEKGLIHKSEHDKRTNMYKATDRGRRELAARVDTLQRGVDP